MITKLEQVKTAQELITFITCFATPTDTESICRMQDIIGHTAVEDLVALARDDGTEIRDGHKWSTGRRGTKAQTMSLLYIIWNWERATDFYNTYVNEETIKARKAVKELEEAKAWLNESREMIKQREKDAKKAEEKYIDEFNRCAEVRDELDEAKQEIMRLKAMLFDYMTKTA